MSLIKKLTKQGNSYSLILDRVLIDLLGIDPATPLEISTTDGKSLLITPIIDVNKKIDLDDKLSKINQKYSKALKKLSE
jgi:antitoxin MazE